MVKTLGVRIKIMEIIDLSRSEIEYLIDEWIIGNNGQRDRKLMKRRLIDGITYENLAEEFDLTERQVKNICYKNMEKLIKHL